MVKWLKVPALVIAFVSLLFPLVVSAEPEGPKEVIDGRYNSFLQLVDNGTLKAGMTEEELFSLMETELAPVIDFNRIARKVMGKYSRQASPEQMKTFSANFKRTLVNTYAKGLENIHNLKSVEIDDAVLGPKGKRAKVNSVIKMSTGQQYQVVYSLFSDRKTKEWKVENLVVEGVNIGIVFRNQFAQYMEQFGNLEEAIANWGK